MKISESRSICRIVFALGLVFIGAVGSSYSQTRPPIFRIVLPERFRLLTGQYFDLRVEAENLPDLNAELEVKIIGAGRSETLSVAGEREITSNNDADAETPDRAWTFRKVSFGTSGIKTLYAIIKTGGRKYGTATQIKVQPFKLQSQKSIILFIGDGMGEAYRDASRIVAQSTGGRFRQGFFDDLQQMDKMPVTGMSMTYAIEDVVPDSANTASAMTMGNKTINGALNVFPDNNDFRYSSADIQGTKRYVLDNPRVETLWQYLKRRYRYRTGIVTTADVTDATPAAEGAQTLLRGLGFDIARQFVDGTISPGTQFDVIMGGGLERFTSRTMASSGDTRNLASELEAAGYTFVKTKAELAAVQSEKAPERLIGLFRTGNMNVAYDKLGLKRPADEPAPKFGGFTDQPFLDQMTEKAIAVLASGNAPFILMVEGASIDKQSHSNYAAGQIWDSIEFDKSIGVGRTFANRDTRTLAGTLLISTADHSQSMSILGAVDTKVPNAVQTVVSSAPYPSIARGGSAGAENRIGETEGFPDYEDTDNDRYPENRNRIKIKVGYRTGEHNGTSVPVTAEGAGSLLFFGYFDQTDIFFKMATALSTDTAALDKALALKRRADVSAFNPTIVPDEPGVVMMRNAPLTGRPSVVGADGRRR